MACGFFRLASRQPRPHHLSSLPPLVSSIDSVTNGSFIAYKIRLSHILGRAHFPHQSSLLKALQYTLEPLLWETAEQLGMHRAGADHVDSD